jgi:hypothetical protein
VTDSAIERKTHRRKAPSRQTLRMGSGHSICSAFAFNQTSRRVRKMDKGGRTLKVVSNVDAIWKKAMNTLA